MTNTATGFNSLQRGELTHPASNRCTSSSFGRVGRLTCAFGVGLAGFEPATFGPPGRSASYPGLTLVHQGACVLVSASSLVSATAVHGYAREFDGKVMAGSRSAVERRCES
jgi:hypothetical protein